MKKLIVTVIILMVVLMAQGQKSRYISIAVTNTNSAMPLNKFGGLVSDVYHPGFEVGYGISHMKSKHDWYHDFRLGYFYHRFVQHGVPLYATLGYRYKFSQSWSVSAELGAGYLHSIPATPKLKLQENGDYKNNKGIGRGQAMVTAGVSVGYLLRPTANKPVRIFATYQQRVQTPFVKAYVPLLPYNSLLLGAAFKLNSK